jgi:hypothetical protein
MVDRGRVVEKNAETREETLGFREGLKEEQ